MPYLIGDTIRLECTVKNFEGVETKPDNISLTIEDASGNKLLNAQTPSLKTGTTAQYFYDWTITTIIPGKQNLIAIWEWSGPHKKRMSFTVQP